MSLSHAIDLRSFPTPSRAYVDATVLARCAEVCADTSIVAEACADACMREPCVEPFDACIRTALMSSVVCEIAGESLAHLANTDDEPRTLRAQLEACVRICAAVGAECDRHAATLAWCRISAEQHRLCAVVIGELLADLPWPR